MKLRNHLILSLVHCLIIISSDSKCLQSYTCGNHILKFPLTDVRNPECGLFMVDGCNSTHGDQTIQLEAGGLRYDLLNVSENRITVGDSELQKLLQERSYFALRNVPLPKSPFASLTLASPNLTLFSCKTEPCSYSFPEISCSTFPVFYEGAASNVTDPKEITDDFVECSMIQVPRTMEHNKDPNFLFNLLTHEFTLEWNVFYDCDQCRRRGGQCLRNSINDFYCREDWNVSENCYGCHRGQGQCLNTTANELCKRGSSRLVLILAISGGGLLFLLCLLISYMIWLLKKKVGMGYVRSSNISFDTSKSDINGGSSFFGIPIFSYTELEAATNNFDPSRELGDGGFGTIYYGKLLDGREVAIKRLYEQNCRRLEQFMNEIKILTSLRHPNLVCLYGCTSRRSRELLLVYEYVSNGTVADHLHGERAEAAPLTWPIRMRIAVETATALAYLHKSDIVHRDVKTDNILLDENFHVKVADFGLSRLFPNDATHISTVPGGTPGYIDPDYHLCYQVTDKSDVYSFGVVLVELVSSMPAVDVSRQTHEINLANWALTRIQRGAFDELVDPSLGYNLDAEVTEMTTSIAEIAFRCLQLEKEMRPSMAEVLAFLKDISN